MKDLEDEIRYEQNKMPSRYTLYRRDPDKEFDYYEDTERLADFLSIKDFSKEHYIDLVDHDADVVKITSTGDDSIILIGSQSNFDTFTIKSGESSKYNLQKKYAWVNKYVSCIFIHK